jgi:hypothetical protein
MSAAKPPLHNLLWHAPLAPRPLIGCCLLSCCQHPLKPAAYIPNVRTWLHAVSLPPRRCMHVRGTWGHSGANMVPPDSAIVFAPHARACVCLHRTSLHCTALHRTTPQCAVLHRGAPYCTAARRTAPRRAVLHRSVLYRSAQRRATPRRTAAGACIAPIRQCPTSAPRHPRAMTGRCGQAPCTPPGHARWAAQRMTQSPRALGPLQPAHCPPMPLSRRSGPPCSPPSLTLAWSNWLGPSLEVSHGSNLPPFSDWGPSE